MKQYSIRLLLIAMTSIAVVVGWIMSARAKGPDNFVSTLNRIGGSNESVLEDNFTTVGPQPKPVNFVAKILGDTMELQSNVVISGCRMTRESANQFASLSDTSKLEYVEMKNVEVDDDVVCFFKNWTSVKEIQFTNVTNFPKSWLEGLAELPNLKFVTFAGANTNVTADDIAKLKQVEYVIASNRNIWGAELETLRKQLPNTDVYVTGLWGEKYPYSKDQTLSEHDPKVHAHMKAIFDDLKSALAELDPPATNGFNPPATIEEIASIEHLIGQPLPPYIRASLELHNGQKYEDELANFNRLLPVERILKDYRNWNYLSRTYDHDDDRFGFSKYWNPRILPIGNSDEPTLGVDLYNRHLIQGDSETYHYDLDGTFPDLIKAITRQIRDEKFDRKRDGQRVSVESGAQYIFTSEYRTDELKRKEFPIRLPNDRSEQK